MKYGMLAISPSLEPWNKINIKRSYRWVCSAMLTSDLFYAHTCAYMHISLDTVYDSEGLIAVEEVLDHKQRKALNEIVDCNQEEFSTQDECRKQCRSSIIREYVEQHPEALQMVDTGEI
jgi:hypothetical protein